MERNIRSQSHLKDHGKLKLYSFPYDIWLFPFQNQQNGWFRIVPITQEANIGWFMRNNKKGTFENKDIIFQTSFSYPFFIHKKLYIAMCSLHTDAGDSWWKLKSGSSWLAVGITLSTPCCWYAFHSGNGNPDLYQRHHLVLKQVCGVVECSSSPSLPLFHMPSFSKSKCIFPTFFFLTSFGPLVQRTELITSFNSRPSKIPSLA